MAVYRFRVSLEDNEDIYRDIEIRAAQNFEEFHKTIQEAFKFDSKHAASFFVSDDYWRKNREITLRKEDLPLEEEEIRKNVEPKKLMKETKVASHIEQPHQRFVYVFDPEAQWTFLVEMIKIAEENRKFDYPVVVKTNGVAPKQYKQVNVAKEELSPDMAMAALLNDMERDVEDDSEPEADEEKFKVLDEAEEGVEEAELSALEGEEGEELDEEAEGAGDELGFGSDSEEEV